MLLLLFPGYFYPILYKQNVAIPLHADVQAVIYCSNKLWNIVVFSFSSGPTLRFPWGKQKDILFSECLVLTGENLIVSRLLRNANRINVHIVHESV